ncbi:MAG: 2-oxoacid:acceptor oxidoreductase family protein [Magnetospiraceae bacterium]
MIEIRIHGRGGQGNVVAAYLLAAAAFEAGMYCQAFPAFGAERRGAPVVAFVRVANQPILRRNQVLHPAFLIIQDETLLHEKGLTGGLLEGGKMLINSRLSDAEIADHYGQPMTSLPATDMARETIGRPLPNVALLAAFLSLTGIAPLSGLKAALQERFAGDVLTKNLDLVELSAAKVTANAWKETAHAARA